MCIICEANKYRALSIDASDPYQNHTRNSELQSISAALSYDDARAWPDSQIISVNLTGQSSSVVSDYTALLSEKYWNGTTPSQKSVILTYSFVKSAAAGSSDPTSNPFVSALNPERQAIVRSALDAWASISGVIFIETQTHEGDLNFGFYDLGNKKAAGDGGYPVNGFYVGSDNLLKVKGGSGESNGGVIRFDDFEQTASVDELRHVALHEIGHSLGLKHPFEGEITLAPTADVTTNTVMSYTGRTPALGPLDIQAIQAIYGDGTADARFSYQWSWNATTETLSQVTTPNSEYVKGTRANDVITLKGGQDAIVTYAGDDAIYADGLTYSQMNLGPGIDTVVYKMLSKDVIVLPSEDKTYIDIRKNGKFEGWERIINVEIVKFIDEIKYFNNYTPYTIVGSGGNDTISGTKGDDSIYGGAGNDITSGEGGIDTAYFSGVRNQYSISTSGFTTTVRDLIVGRDGIDSLWNVERLSFVDKVIVDPSSLNPIGIAIADQLSVVYFGRGISFDWRNSTATVVENGASPGILTAFYDAAVADRAFGASDSLQTIVNKTFNNIFGVNASAFEQNAWAATVNAGAVSREALPWQMFNSYLGATNVPVSYQVPAQSRIIAVNAFTNAVQGGNEAALGNAGALSAESARDWLRPIRGQSDAGAKVLSAERDVGSIATSTLGRLESTVDFAGMSGTGVGALDIWIA